MKRLSMIHPVIFGRYHGNFQNHLPAWWFVKFTILVITGGVGQFLPEGGGEVFFFSMLGITLLLQLWFNPIDPFAKVVEMETFTTALLTSCAPPP